MTVQVWVGEIPEHAQEREAIVALARALAPLDDLYLILANFTVGGQAVDLAIFKRNAGLVIELKHCDGRVIGGVNGKWQVVDANGEVHIINPGRRNPYNQVISYFYRLSNFLNQHRTDFLSEHRAAEVDFRTCKRLVVIAPFVHPESEIVLDWKVDLKGLDELPTYLVTTVSSEINLSEEELLAIPRLLRCEPWHDVNLLVGEPVSAEAAPSVGREAQVAAIPQRRPALRLLRNGFLGLALLLLAVIGLASGLFSSASVVPTPQPTATLVRPPTPDSRPPQTPTPQVAQVEQAIARTSAFADGEVVVTLRWVTFADDRITLTWALENRGHRSVRFPLNGKNVAINDNILNAYLVDESLSRPAVLVAWPGERVEGTCTVPRPVSPDAITLTVRVLGEPFEEKHVWILNVPGRE
ncbi:MAG: nuclease-related domain-containing protein [Chloroflexia bacterium]